MIKMEKQNKNFAVNEIARMLDLSAVKMNSTEKDIRDMAELARKYNCVACFAMPGYTKLLAELINDCPETCVGGVIGFPSGATTTTSKLAEVDEMLNLECGELDTVINVGKFKSGDNRYVSEEIRAIVKAAEFIPVKVILECHYLSHKEIETACHISADAGASFVKTGTGWAPTGATEENIALMKRAVGEKAQVKAAGGVRDLDTLLKFYRLGATRFGVGSQSAKLILEQAKNDK